MTLRLQPLALAPLLLAMAGACLPTLAPGIRSVEHHAGLTGQSGNDTCMACHEAEQQVLEGLAAMSEGKREVEMRHRMEGGGASLVAQWMIDDERSCAGCHTPRTGPR